MAERKLLHLRRDDSCANCACPLTAGTEAYWLKPERVVLCVPCGGATPPAPVGEAGHAPPANAAGASARRVHERRRDSREARLRASCGRIGGWAARMSSGPQHERAWAVGALGEEENARRFAKHLAEEAVVVLHDRRVPGSRANLDHLAIGQGGVTVVDSKKLDGKVRVDWQGSLFSERRFDLYVNGRRRTGLVESVERQVEVVRSILMTEGFPTVEVKGALCMANPEHLPLLRQLSVRDIVINGPRRIARLMARPGDLDAATVERLAITLDRRLPPA